MLDVLVLLAIETMVVKHVDGNNNNNDDGIRKGRREEQLKRKGVLSLNVIVRRRQPLYYLGYR